jgi:hypothetical protein
MLLLLLGSDLHMMERLTAYDRPFYGRADNLVLGPLNPADTGRALGLTAPDAIDAHLVSGGLPGIVRTWPQGMPALEFLRQEAADPAAAVFGVPEAALMAESGQVTVRTPTSPPRQAAARVRSRRERCPPCCVG